MHEQLLRPNQLLEVEFVGRTVEIEEGGRTIFAEISDSSLDGLNVSLRFSRSLERGQETSPAEYVLDLQRCVRHIRHEKGCQVFKSASMARGDFVASLWDSGSGPVWSALDRGC